MSEMEDAIPISPEMALAGGRAIMARWLELTPPENDEIFASTACDVFREMFQIMAPLRHWTPIK